MMAPGAHRGGKWACAARGTAGTRVPACFKKYLNDTDSFHSVCEFFIDIVKIYKLLRIKKAGIFRMWF